MSGEFKSCPYCGKIILSNATICKHCGANLTHWEIKMNSSSTMERNNTVNVDNSYSCLHAFSYMFQDKKFPLKWLSVFLISFIGNIVSLSMQSNMQKADFNIIDLAPIFLAAFLMFVLVGYKIMCIKSITNQSHNYTLPFISYFDNFISGLKFYIATIVFLIAIFLPIALLGTIPIINIVVFVVGAIIFIVFLYRVIAYNWIFANKPMYTVFFRFGLSWEVIIQDHKRYFTVLCFLFLSVILSLACNLFLYLTGLLFYEILTLGIAAGAISLVTTYFSFVNSYLIAKSITPNSLNLL